MELTILERIKLLEVLPKEGDLLTLKILRKLRESLSFSEDELKTFGAVYEYACPHIATDKDGKRDKCLNIGFFTAPPKCGKHNIPMQPTGQMNISIPPQVINKVKEIHMGTHALTIASNALKRLNDNQQLTEGLVSLYEKFFPPEEVEIPEAIKKAMGE